MAAGIGQAVMAKVARSGNSRGGRRPAAARRPADRSGRTAGCHRGAVIVLGAVLVLRLTIVALQLVPVHFDEAQYWAYAQEPDWGYYSKPPLVAWLIRAVTLVAGDSIVALRAASPVCHALIGWLIFLAGRRLWDGQTGFWAAIGYTAAPGVAYSSMLMTTDPVLMVLWAAALYALVRAGDTAPGHAATGNPSGRRDRTRRKNQAGAGGVAATRLVQRRWWIALGLAIGLGLLAKYTMIAFAIGALGYGLVSARGRDWTGALIAAGTALAVVFPNIVWNAQHGLATVAHVLSDADPGKGRFRPLELLEFGGAQFAVIGPVFMAAILLALRHFKTWGDDRGMRLCAWLTVPLLAAMTVLALATRSNANWAAPAYIAGSLMAARWLLTGGGRSALKAQVGIGIAASLLLWILSGFYAGQADRLTRRLDPFVQTRLAEPFCELALGHMAEEGVGVLLSDNRRRLSECMFLGGLGWREVAIWNPAGRIASHHEMVASLQPGDDREMLLVVRRGAESHARHFAQAREIETVHLGVHLDQSVAYQFWVVQGFRGY